MARRAADSGGSAGGAGGRGPRTLSASARRASAGFATLLRAFALDGDRLWTPEPVAAERMAAVDGLPRPELVSGRLERLAVPPGEAVLAWGETAAVARIRRRGAVAARPPADDPPGWLGVLRRLPAAAPEVAARMNDRRFCLELAGELGRALPGARSIRSVAELAEHLRSGACDAGGGAWVAKAPWSAAGRHRVIRSGLDALGDGARLDAAGSDPALRGGIERLLERSGALVVEPWVERTADYGAAGLVLPDGGMESLGTHRLEVDRRGAFTGLVLEGPLSARSVDPAARAALESTLESVGRRLAGAGYVGPFGIDGFTWREPGGASHVHPLSEINARLTFGLVARALAVRCLQATPADEAAAGRPAAAVLRLGRPLGARGDDPVVSRSIELLTATAEAPGAWLEPRSG